MSFEWLAHLKVHRVKTLSHLFTIVLVGQSAWASQAHQEARTSKPPCAACQPASRTTPLNGLSLTWSVSVNSMPWQQSARRARAPVASWPQMTAWPPAQQHQRAPTTPTAAHGTPVAPQEDPGPTCRTACRSSSLWKVKASAWYCVSSISWSVCGVTMEHKNVLVKSQTKTKYAGHFWR